MPDDFANMALPITIVAKVTPRAKKECVRQQTRANGNVFYRVYVHAAPENGKANEAVIKLLATVFKIPRSQVTIVSGQASRNKIIKIGS